MQLKSLKKKLKEAEKRAITAERTVKTLLKEVDTKEGKHYPRNITQRVKLNLYDLRDPRSFHVLDDFSRRAQGGEGKVQGSLRRHGRDVRRDDRILGYSLSRLFRSRYAPTLLSACSLNV